MKDVAYNALVEIRQILEEADVFVKRGLALPPGTIPEINKLEALSRSVEAYAIATGDKKIIEETGKIPRFELQAIFSWYDIPRDAKTSLARCIRSLHNVARMNKQEDVTLEEKTIPEELNTDEAKAIFKRAINAGFMDENYKFVGTWYQAAYFAERAAESLKLKYKWKPFQTLWNYDKLAQVKREIKERFGRVDKQREIDKIFDS